MPQIVEILIRGEKDIHVVNTMAADGLATERPKESAAVVFT